MSEYIHHEGRISLFFDPDQPDLMIINEIFRLNRYQILFPQRQVPPPILDIGAYKGYFSAMCAYHGAQVFAFEPNENSREVMMRNLDLNQLQAHEFAKRRGPGSVWLSNAAVWKERTRLHLHSHPTSHGCDTLINGNVCHGDCGAPGSMVDCVPFDEVIGDTHWAFVKMDCEGAEYEILLNASHKSLSQIDQIAIELHGPESLIVAFQGPLINKLNQHFTLAAHIEFPENPNPYWFQYKYLYGVKR